MQLYNLRLLLLRHCLNVGDDNIDGTNQEQHRDRINLAIQWAIEDFVNAYSWSWRMKTGTADVDTNGVGTLPYDFGTFGAYGGVTIDAKRHRLQRIPEQQILDLRTKDQSTTVTPRYYCEAGQTIAPGIEGQRNIIVHARPSELVTLNLVYYFRPPLISLTGDFVTGNDDDFLLIPAEYHAGVIYEGAAARLYFNEGDPRSLEVQQRYELAKARAWTNDHSYQWPRKRPRFSVRGGAYR